jgi:hypothetical protein
LALDIALQKECDGIELHSLWSYDPAGQEGVYSVHAPWWTTTGRDALMREQTPIQNLHTMFWNRCIGVFEKSRAIEYALSSVRKRLVVHVGLAMEIFEMFPNPAGLFEGLEVSIEEGESLYHHSFVGLRWPENTTNLIGVYDRLSELGVNVSVTLDPEHMAKNMWPWKKSFFDEIFLPKLKLIGNRKIAEIHLVDYVRGGGGIKNGGNRLLGTGGLELERVVKHLDLSYPPHRLRRRASGSMVKHPLCSAGALHRQAFARMPARLAGALDYISTLKGGWGFPGRPVVFLENNIRLTGIGLSRV